MSLDRASIYPMSVVDIILMIGRLSDDSFGILDAALNDRNPFDVSPNRVASLSYGIGVSREAVLSIVEACDYLNGRLHNVAQNGNYMDVFDSIASDELGIEDPDLRGRVALRLAIIARSRDNIDAYRRRETLKSGFIKNATSLSYLVDLRPVFGARLEILEIVPMVQLRVATDSGVPGEEEITFQADKQMLKHLQKTLESALEKIEAINQSDKIIGFLIGDKG